MDNSKKLPSNKKEKVVAPNLKKQNLFETICSYGITILCFIFFGYVAIMSVLQTSEFDSANFGGEVIQFNYDDLVMNFFLLGGFFLLVFALSRYANVFKKVSDLALVVGLSVYTITLGFIWIFMAQSVPAADSGTVTQTAMEAAKGNYQSFQASNDTFYNNVSYYKIYPFQLGFVFISEIVYRIFGTTTSMPMQVFNVLALTALYIAIVAISKRLFKSKSVTFITVFMLAGCIQGILFTTFVYGNIIGIASAMWACYFVIRFMQSEEKRNYLNLLPASLLMALSVVAKYNNMIWLAAICIALLIYIIKNKKWLHFVSIAFVVLISVGSFNLVIMSYEKRSGVDFGKGVDQILYLDAGLNESAMAPGWYNDMAKSKFLNANLDNKLADSWAKTDMKERLNKFKQDSHYRNNFFSKKILSQWNEPSYESLWVSQVKGHYFGEVKENTTLYSIYSGKINKFLYDYFDFFQMITFILFAIGVAGLIKKRCSAETIMILTGLAGGFIYHTLFEGKSQYVLTYFIVMIMFSSYGLYLLVKPKNFNNNSDSEKETLGDKFKKIIFKIDSKTRQS